MLLLKIGFFVLFYFACTFETVPNVSSSIVKLGPGLNIRSGDLKKYHQFKLDPESNQSGDSIMLLMKFGEYFIEDN